MTRDRALTTSATSVTAAVAAVTFYVAYDDGGYSLTSRSTIAIGVWWTILVGVGLGYWRLERVPRGAVVPGALLALFAGWVLASAAWSSSAEDAFAEFDRAALYLGIYAVAVLAAGSRLLARSIDGLTVAIAAIGLVALISRLFPGSFPSRGLPKVLPNASARLSFPLGYWNGLGIFVGLAFPLLLHSALGGGRGRRASAVGVMPALGTAVYLTSSRGAVAALIGGILVFLLAAPRPWAAFGAMLTAAAGTAASIAVLMPRHELVNGPFDSTAARSEGWQAAVLIVLICIATAAVFETAAAIAPRPAVPARIRRGLVAAAIVTLIVAGGIVAHEARPIQDFTRLPTAAASTAPGDSVGEHLLSGGGSGRWQFWTSAVDEFRSAPLQGGGAGSYEAWWARHGSFAYFVKDAHSVYLETLGELGIVGFVLLVGALAAAVVVGVRRLRARDAERAAIASLLGVLTTYLIGAGTDWMWELTAVTLVGMCALGLLTGPATLPPASSNEPARARGMRWRLPLSIGVAVAACAVVAAEAIPLLADVEVRSSQADVGAGRSGLARSHAVAASKIEPWAATPYLQLALVEEGAGNLADARRAIDEAIQRDREDWRPWFVAARIETRLGDVATAARSRARARSLNPRSPLFSQQR
jgi:hypothetical protein